MENTTIITGAGGNLGRAITQNLLRVGCHVHVAVGPGESPDFLTQPNLTGTLVNLLVEAEVETFLSKAHTNSANKRIDTLICIVGGYTEGSIEDTTIEHIHKMLQLNFETAYLVTHHLIKICRQQQTPLQIIFIGARPAIDPKSGNQLVAYGLSKSLLFKLAEYINVETNQTGISASVIVPSTLDTVATRKAMPDANPADWVPTQAVAETVAFILSDTGKMMRQSVYKLYNNA